MTDGQHGFKPTYGRWRDVKSRNNGLFTFTDLDSDSDPDSNPIPVVGS